MNKRVMGLLGVVGFMSLTGSGSGQAAGPCDIREISGVWAVAVHEVSFYYGPEWAYTDTGLCWFVISRNNPNVGNLRIDCGDAEYFMLNQTDFEFKPWHQLVRSGGLGKSVIVGGRRFPTPNRCEWKIIDRNDLDGEYQVFFSPDRQSFTGFGEGNYDKHFGNKRPFARSFQGIRQ